MKKIHLIMPMAGGGTRFAKNGFQQPKPLITLNKKPFFYWSTMSILKGVDVVDITFVVLQEHIDQFAIDKEIKKFFPEAYVISIPEILPGPVFTCLEGIKYISDEFPLVFNDCDHMFSSEKLYEILNSDFKYDGILATFLADESQFSYVQYDESGKIQGTIEKKVVSNHAICGAYIFKSVKLFRETAKKYIADCPYNECFMSGMYNVMCRDGKDITDILLDYHVEYGTPLEYEKAQKSEYFQDFLR